MGLLDDVVCGANTVAENVGKFVGGVVDISKLKVSNAELKDKIRREYEGLGKLVYRLKSEGIELPEDIDSKIERIAQLLNDTTAIEMKLAKLQDKVLCKECGFSSDSEACFCSKCGAKLEKPVEDTCMCEKECNCEDNKEETAEGEQTADSAEDTATSESNTDDAENK